MDRRVQAAMHRVAELGITEHLSMHTHARSTQLLFLGTLLEISRESRWAQKAAHLLSVQFSGEVRSIQFKFLM